MATIYINARCQKIVNLLLMGEDYISLKEIAEETGVSKRSIYYDLCKINEWLDYYEIDEIEVIRGKGILISKLNKKKIAEIVESESGEESYIFSPTERAKIIYCYIMIMHLSHPVYIDQIAEYCQVSRNTIFNDLKVVVNQLQEYNLSLAYEPKKGYWITGDVIHISTFLYRYQSGIQIGNPMTDDIMREYQSLFDITKVVSRYLEQLVEPSNSG